MDISDVIENTSKVKFSDISDDKILLGKKTFEKLDLSQVIFDAKPKAFSKLETPLELANYLSSREKILQSRSGDLVSHYTSVDNLEKILTSKTLYLSNPANMNDGLEFETSANYSHLFFSSFSLESSENIGMWSMYGQPWNEGVRISIPKKDFLNWQKSINCIYEVDLHTKKITSRVFTEGFKPSISRVAYVNIDEKNKVNFISCGDTQNEIIKDIDSNHLVGFIKDAAWSYEKEVRLRVDVASAVNIACIAIDIPDNIVDNMIITTGPRFNSIDFENRIGNQLDVRKSIFKDKLNYVYCDKCKELKIQ